VYDTVHQSSGCGSSKRWGLIEKNKKWGGGKGEHNVGKGGPGIVCAVAGTSLEKSQSKERKGRQSLRILKGKPMGVSHITPKFHAGEEVAKKDFVRRRKSSLLVLKR